jgi:hypothetical protein
LAAGNKKERRSALGVQGRTARPSLLTMKIAGGAASVNSVKFFYNHKALKRREIEIEIFLKRL